MTVQVRHATREEALYNAYQRGQWSFTAEPKPNVLFAGANLLRTITPPEYAQGWTIQLNAFRYYIGPLAAGLPPDNQTDINPIFQATVRWGTDGPSETAVVDYPAAGCTFAVQASTVTVDINGSNTVPGATPPRLSGALVPVANIVVTATAPQLTSFARIVGPGSNLVIPVPARASAYRVFFADVPALQQVTIQQLSGASVVQQDGQVPTSLTADAQMSNRAGYYVINPYAQAVRLSNVGLANTTVGLTFLLDLG